MLTSGKYTPECARDNAQLGANSLQFIQKIHSFGLRIGGGLVLGCVYLPLLRRLCGGYRRRAKRSGSSGCTCGSSFQPSLTRTRVAAPSSRVLLEGRFNTGGTDVRSSGSAGPPPRSRRGCVSTLSRRVFSLRILIVPATVGLVSVMGFDGTLRDGGDRSCGLCRPTNTRSR